MIDGGVVRDLENPGRKLELGTIRFDPVQHFDERFLRVVFSVRAIAHHPVERRKHRTLVATHELPECGSMTLLFPKYNAPIAGGAEVVPPIFHEVRLPPPPLSDVCARYVHSDRPAI